MSNETTQMTRQEMLKFLDRIEDLESENARINQENQDLLRLMVRCWEWFGVKPHSPLPSTYRRAMKEYSGVVKQWRTDNEGVKP